METIKHGSSWPYLIAVPATSTVVALSSTGLALGTAGIVGGAAIGLLWSVVLGTVIERLIRRHTWRPRLANGSVFVGIVASGVMLGGGVMYGLLMKAAAAAPLTVLSAMMQPTIPFFIVLNTPLEWLIVPTAVFSNWQNAARRRWIVIAATSFYAMRIWSYLTYVRNRVDIASRPLLPEDLEWFQRSMAADYRSILVAVVLVALTASAFVTDPASRVRPERTSQGS